MQSGENVYQYFARGKELRQMLADAGEKIEERVLVLALLTGLTNRFRNFVDIIMVTGEIPKLEVLLPKLMVVEGFESQSDALGNGAPALFSGSSRNRNRPLCSNCGKMGHTADKCWATSPAATVARQVILRPAASRSAGNRGRTRTP
ncbi:hypothetical protein VaNZ11_007567 [Volvox africanus]|uniref:CCHC-type domain-containing protein n=1 Tax=Volvox africanus TaxID=51714 RepID=A0ABQ5S352_9CHLO|nr:hypothetical protein VaNZ11_007567 [Volvox africanus]